MKKAILFFFSIMFLVTCTNEKSKGDFIGNWSSTYDTNVYFDIEYYLDSIVVYNSILLRTYSLKWKVKGEKIHQKLLRYNGRLENTKSTLDFKFTKNKDTLFLKHEKDSIFHIKLRKIESNFEHLENRIGLNLNLPKTSEKLTEIENKELAFKIF